MYFQYLLFLGTEVPSLQCNAGYICKNGAKVPNPEVIFDISYFLTSTHYFILLLKLNIIFVRKNSRIQIC